MLEIEDLHNLEYTQCVYKEALRLWPPIPSVNRITNEDLFINSYFIPKDTEISVGEIHLLKLQSSI